jgi:hypothetical protein
MKGRSSAGVPRRFLFRLRGKVNPTVSIFRAMAVATAWLLHQQT